MSNKASFKEVNLRNAKVTGQIDMSGARFDGTLDADFLQAGGPLLMQSDGQKNASFKEVNLRSAKVTGQIDMSGANFDGKLPTGGWLPFHSIQQPEQGQLQGGESEQREKID